MFIIKDGDKEIAEKKKKQTRRFECKICGCVFEADKGEYRGEECCGFCYEYYAKCPCCRNKVYEAKGKFTTVRELLKDETPSKKYKEFYEKKKVITERLRKDNENFKK